MAKPPSFGHLSTYKMGLVCARQSRGLIQTLAAHSKEINDLEVNKLCYQIDSILEDLVSFLEARVEYYTKN